MREDRGEQVLRGRARRNARQAHQAAQVKRALARLRGSGLCLYGPPRQGSSLFLPPAAERRLRHRS
jgi:hypothetical protein